MRRLAGFLALAGASLFAGCAGEGKVENVVLIVVDTLRADAVSDPDGRYTTPHIDALAGDGVLFSSAFTHAPMTLPAHTSLFSSRLPIETGILNNGQDVPADLPLVAEWLAGAGWQTRGVISLGTLQGRKLHRGFDAYDQKIFYQSSAADVTERIKATFGGWDPARPLFLFAHFSDPHSPYNDHDAEKKAMVHLNGEKLAPLSISTMDVRWGDVLLQPGENVFEFRSPARFKVMGFVAKEEKEKLPIRWDEGKVLEATKHVRLVVERPEDAQAAECEVKMWLTDVPGNAVIPERYAMEVEYVDRFVGAVVEELKERGLYDDSLVIFTSDHGESLGEHDYFGHVRYLTDEEIQVPLIVKPPKGHRRLKRKLGDRKERLARHIDLVPTLLELAEVPPLPGQRGKSLLDDEEIPHLAQTHKPESLQDKICLRDEEFKLIYIVDEDRFVMYDLVNDPFEQQDVFDTRGDERAEWCERLRAIGRTAAERGPLELDEETRANLEALGYV